MNSCPGYYLGAKGVKNSIVTIHKKIKIILQKNALTAF